MGRAVHYVVTARWWNSNLQNRFGDDRSIFFLTDDEVLKAIIEFGRAEITEKDGMRYLEFQNDYD